MNQSHSPKICTLDELLVHRRASRNANEKLVHCHGCFDIVHPGHIRHLKYAKALGDRLLVTLTADEFVNKGDSRPMFKQDLRAENLAALEFVDWVLINPSPTATQLLEQVQPDVYVKGAEYESNQDPRFARERDTVEQHGGRVVFTSGDIVYSSSALIRSMSSDQQQGQMVEMNPLSRENGFSTIGMAGSCCGLTRDRLEYLLSSMRGRKVLVVGESIIDSYIDCDWPEVTGEAPVLSLRPGRRVNFDGGAAVIARHLEALGARPILLTPIPKSLQGDELRHRLEVAGIEVQAVEVDTPIPLKERYMVGLQKMFKLDHTQKIELDHQTRISLVERAKSIGSRVDAAIVADFGLGMIGPQLAEDLFAALRGRVDVLSGDVSGARPTLLKMNKADLLMPSERELRASVLGVTGSLPAVVAKLMDLTEANRVAVTMAQDGLILFSRREEVVAADGQPTVLRSKHVPALNKSPIDTLGCGDALLAVATLAQSVGADPYEAAVLGSVAAAACGAKMGNQSLELSEIRARFVQVSQGQEQVTIPSTSSTRQTESAFPVTVD